MGCVVIATEGTNPLACTPLFHKHLITVVEWCVGGWVWVVGWIGVGVRLCVCVCVRVCVCVYVCVGWLVGWVFYVVILSLVVFVFIF